MTADTAGPVPLSQPIMRSYSRVAMLFHWVIAGLVVYNLYLGWLMEHSKGMSKFTSFQLHKSIGITVLALTVLRFFGQFTHKPPAYPATMLAWEQIAASVTHWTFYALMIILPFSGWIVVSASMLSIPTLLYKWLPLPHLAFIHDQPPATRIMIDHNVGSAHVVLAYCFGALILIHVAAALKHQFVERDGVLRRMLP